jgi:hypothetical protein
MALYAIIKTDFKDTLWQLFQINGYQQKSVTPRVSGMSDNRPAKEFFIIENQGAKLADPF